MQQHKQDKVRGKNVTAPGSNETQMTQTFHAQNVIVIM